MQSRLTDLVDGVVRSCVQGLLILVALLLIVDGDDLGEMVSLGSSAGTC